MSATIVHQPWLLVGQRVPSGISLNLSFMTPGTLDPRITFTRASTATYFDATGTLQTAAVNAPRWDYDLVAHTLNGLLIEEARTNSVLNSATLVTQNVTVTAVPWTLSFYGTGTVTKSGTASGALVGTGAGQRVSQTFTPTAGSLTLTVTGTVSNAQLESGAFPTSYIPTTAASVTRAGEVCSMPTTPWYSASASSLVGEFMVAQSPNPSATLGREGCCICDGTGSNRLALRAQGPSLAGTNVITSISGTNTFIAPAGSTLANAAFKMGGTWNGVTAVGCFNGAVTVPSAVGIPGSITTLIVGNATTSSALWLNGWVRRVRYWPRALTNAELQSVTR